MDEVLVECPRRSIRSSCIQKVELRMSSAKAPTRRVLAKEATQTRVLDAAHQLFSTEGWEATTIRAVADEAGMSTGAIFAHYAGKTDLFIAVMRRQLCALANEIETICSAVPAEQALVLTIMRMYERADQQLPLVGGALQLLWSGESGRIRSLNFRAELQRVFVGLMTKALASAEQQDSVGVELRSRILLDCVIANFHDALDGTWDLGSLEHRVRGQVRVALG